MKLKVRGSRVGVEKQKKTGKSHGPDYIKVPGRDEFYGIIRYIGQEAAKDLKVGQHVYFNTNYHQAHVGGIDICLMNDTEILAVVDDEETNNTQK